MKRKIAICLTLITLAAIVCGALAGCSDTLTADEGAQAVLDALNASKAFLTDCDKAEGYKYYTKYSTLSEDGKSSETYYLNYQQGKENFEDFLFVQYTSTITSAGTSVTTSEYLGDVLPNAEAEDKAENYIRVYTDNKKDSPTIKRMSKEEFLGREDIDYLTLEYILALFDNLDKEDIVIKEGGATISGVVTTIAFTVSDTTVPIASYENITVRIMNDKIVSVETNTSANTSVLTMDYYITYYAPNAQMPSLDYSKA